MGFPTYLLYLCMSCLPNLEKSQLTLPLMLALTVKGASCVSSLCGQKAGSAQKNCESIFTPQ